MQIPTGVEVKPAPFFTDELIMFTSKAGSTSALISITAVFAIFTVFTGARASAQLASGSAFLFTDSAAPTAASSRYQTRPKRARSIDRRVQSEASATVPEVESEAISATPVAAAVEVAPPVRLNPVSDRGPILEINIAPGFLYSNSRSDYSFREYTSAAPVIGAGARVWLSPEFALNGSFDTSLSGNVSDAHDGSRNVSAVQEWLSVGFRTKKTFGPTRPGSSLASSMVFGADYYEYNFKVPSNSQIRDSLTSKGLKVSLDAELAPNAGYAWTFGFWFAPKLFHHEERSAANFESGGSVDTNAVGASFGGKILFEKSDAMFWKIGYSIEKNQFGGPATVNDPRTGISPSGVSVFNGTALLQFGYTWAR